MATNEHSTSRRAVIMGLAGTPFLAGTMTAPAIASQTDATLEAHWREYLASQRTIYDSPDPTNEECEAQTSRLNRVEDAILKHPAATTHDAAIKLWVALPHIDANRWIEEAIAYGRFGEIIDNQCDLDFDCRLVVAAIVALGWEA
jgi:hypothetical protein